MLDNDNPAFYSASAMTNLQFESGKMGYLRLNDADAYLLNELQAKMGLNITGLLRLGIRRLAQQQGINLQKQATPRKKSA